MGEKVFFEANYQLNDYSEETILEYSDLLDSALRIDTSITILKFVVEIIIEKFNRNLFYLKLA